MAKLTDYELAALGDEFNMCDGHARYISDVPPHLVGDVVRDLLNKPDKQLRVEASFLHDFAKLAEQDMSLEPDDVLLCPSASIAIELVANHLRLHRMSVALIEPVFDNLADILARHDVPLVPLQETNLSKMDIVDCLAQSPADAYFLVVPNNPTGYCITASQFETLVNFCARNRKLLILDFSFRHFASRLSRWNQYSLLKAANVEYVTVEDTGKTWPTAELKVSVLSASNTTFRSLREIYRDIFINHSPIAILVVGLFVRNSLEKGLEKTVLNIVDENRRRLRTALAATPLIPVTHPNVSVEWIQLPEFLTDTALERRLSERNIRVLPGSEFYWTGSSDGRRYVRIAMMRDTEKFAESVSKLEIALSEIIRS